MQRATVSAVFLFVEAFKEVEQLGCGRSGLVRHDTELLYTGPCCEGLVRAVERDQRDGDIRRKDKSGSLRVDVDIEFGCRRDVSTFEETAAHGDDALDAWRDARFPDEGKADIGEWAKAAKGHRAGGVLHQGLDDEIDRVLALKGHGGIGQFRPVKTRAAVDVFSCYQCAQHRPNGAGIDLDVRAACQFTNLAGVHFRQGQWHIARHGSDAEDVDFGGSQGQKYGYGVVLAGIGVDDDRV